MIGCCPCSAMGKRHAWKLGIGIMIVIAAVFLYYKSFFLRSHTKETVKAATVEWYQLCEPSSRTSASAHTVIVTDWCRSSQQLLDSYADRIRHNTAHSEWLRHMVELQQHIAEDCYLFDDYRVANWNPPVFTWPEGGDQNKQQVGMLMRMRDVSVCPPKFSHSGARCWMELALYRNDYGPRGILQQSCYGWKLQLDRVQHVWNLFEATKLRLPLDDENVVLFEFGAGTGQMSSVIQDSGFQGMHVVYDFLAMQLMQRRFNSRGLNGTRFVAAENSRVTSADRDFLMSGGVTNYVPSGDIASLTSVLSRPKLFFVSTYSFTETDLATQAVFAPHFKNFDGIFIVFWDKFGAVNNLPIIDTIAKSCEHTHEVSVEPYFTNGNALRIVRKM